MLIEFELNGSRAVHKGIFDTNGFWVKFDEDREIVDTVNGLVIKDPIVDGYKIFSHFSFSYYHEDFNVASKVFLGLTTALAGIDWADKEIGFIREIC